MDNFSALLTQYIVLNLNILLFFFLLSQLGNHMERFSCPHLFIRIVNQGKNEFKIFKMPLLREEMFYKNEPENVVTFFFLCKDVFVMCFMIRISNADKLT